LRSCSSPASPSSSGAISGSNGFEAVLNGWYSLAIKPEKMREPGGGGEESQGGTQRLKFPNEKKPSRGDEERQNRGKFWSLNQQKILVLLPPLSSS